MTAPPTRVHHAKSFLDCHLQTCKRVFVRNDQQQQPLRPRYKGPFDVTKRKAKYFVISEQGKERTISIDRLKACHDADNPEQQATEVLSHDQTATVVDLLRTRLGRIINKPFRFRNHDN